MSNLPTFRHSSENGTVTVTHQNYTIRDYAEVRSGQLESLLAVLGRVGDADDELRTVLGLAQELSMEVSALVEFLARNEEMQNG
jgi:hypothetical protein